MKQTQKMIFGLLLFALSFSSSFANELIERTVDGHKAKMIKVSPNSGYKVVVSASNEATTLQSLVEKMGGVSGVNGAYFCPKDYPQCGQASFSNTMRIVNGDGKTYSKYYPDMGINGLFWFDATNSPVLLKQSIWSGNADTNFNTGAFESVKNGLANFPIYLHEGKDMLSLYSETEIDAKMRAKSLKNFICAKKDGTILMGGIEGVTIFEMPNLLLKFDCYNALNLDTGGSTAMTFNGKYIKGPGRNIMDAFVVVKMTPEEVAATLTPAVTPSLPVDNTQESAQKMLRTLLSSIQTKSQGNSTKKEQLLQDLKKRLALLISRSKNKKQRAIYEAVLEKIQ